MKAFYADKFVLPLPEGHRFPMPKYTRLRERVQAAGLFAAEDLDVAEPASEAQLLRVHTGEYVNKVLLGSLSERETRRIGFPWSPGLVERSRRSVGGTIQACRAGLERGIAANLAGGTHHAYPEHGEGFCVFNDVAVAARTMQDEDRAGRVVVIDCDVHQGNGTAVIFAGDPSVFTFSIHGQKNFPFHKEQSDLDIALPDATGDEDYLAALRLGLDQSLAAGPYDLALFIAGADPFEGDSLGRMALTKAGLLQRDRMVFEACQALSLPVVIVMGGGYARQVEDTVDIHFQTLALAIEMF